MKNKMTPKEALIRLHNQATRYFNPNDEKDQIVNKRFEEYKSIIEQALTELEKQKQILEVLNNKKVDVMRLCCSDLLVYYNEGGIYEELTQEEFDLLKKWLKQ